jgi:hypothetical protein
MFTEQFLCSLVAKEFLEGFGFQQIEFVLLRSNPTLPSLFPRANNHLVLHWCSRRRCIGPDTEHKSSSSRIPVNPFCWGGTEHRMCSGIVTVQVPLILSDKLGENFGWVGRFHEFDDAFGNHWRVAVLQRKSYRRVGSQIAHLDRVGSRANPEFSQHPNEPNRHQMRSSIGADGGHPNVRLISQSLFDFDGWIRSHGVQGIAKR